MSLEACKYDLVELFDALPDGLIKVDPYWVVLYMNAAAERLLSIDRQQVQGTVLWEISDRLPSGFVQRTRTAEQPITSGVYERNGSCIWIAVIGMDQGCRVVQVRDTDAERPAEKTPNRSNRELECEIKRRKEAEIALEANQEFLQAVLDNIEAGIVACDETGTLKLFNNAARAFHGVPETPIPPEDWPAKYDLYYPDGSTLLRKNDVPLFRAFSGEVVRHTEMVIAPRTGHTRTLLASGRALIGQGGRKLGAVVAMHDITHRKLAGARIGRALRQFRALFNDAPIAYHEIDRLGVIRRVNRAECRLLGLTRDEMIGQSVWEFVPEAVREATKNAVLEKLSGQRPLEQAELQYLTRSGKHLVLELHENLIHSNSGEIAGIRTAMLDITDRIQREQQTLALTQEKIAREDAEAASAQIRSILERIGDAYMAFDTEWRYTYVNRKAAELALKPASELIGRCVWDEFPEAVHTPFFSELQRAMRDQISVHFDNYYAPLGKWFENSVYPSPSGVGVFYRDITDRVRTQRALEERTEEVNRKNAELETFAYFASHDLQEPLRMISGYAALLARRYSGVLDADANEFLSFMTGAVDRMQCLIRDLLALCRLEQTNTPQLDDVDMTEIIDVVSRNLELIIEDTAAVIIRRKLPVVRFNETQLLQILQNLIGNALKYRSEAPPIITVTAERGADSWTVSVNDNGVGFDMTHASAIFKPFKRLQRGDNSGTGIGLAICKKIIERRGGRIWVESGRGRGSTFSFIIPDTVPTGE